MIQIPKLGLGTWKLKDSQGQQSIETALELGYRHIDTADWYKNHDIVGRAIKNSGVKREEIFLVTKIYPPLTQKNILNSGPRLLDELQVDYVDLLLVHWPDSNPTSQVLESFMSLKEKGITKEIGVSNFSNLEIKECLEKGFPVINHQFEINPWEFDRDLINLCLDNNITVTSYSSFGEGSFFSDDKKDQREKITEIAKEVGATTPQVVLAWLRQQNIITIPKASTREHLEENWKSQNVNLSESQIEILNNL